MIAAKRALLPGILYGPAVLTGLLWIQLAAAAEPPRVVASLAPLQSLAAGVLGDVGTPDVVIQGYGSPHSYQMRPSDARKLAAADLVIWVGEPLETFLAAPIRNLSADAAILTLLDAPGMTLHATRPGSVWAEDAADDHHDGDHHDHDHLAVDPHLWLAPGNAKRIVDAVVAALSARDPDRAAAYAANGAASHRRLDQLEGDIRERLAGFGQTPFLVFHDVLQYYERAFQLRSVGAVTTHPDRAPGARSLRALKQAMAAAGVRCILIEPQFASSLIDRLTDGSAIATVAVDPLGASLTPGPAAYFDMMTTLTENLVSCLESGQ